MKKRMSLERLAVVLLAAVALAGFIVSPALGGPGFLTKKQAGKIYLKKSAANSRFLTKAGAGSQFYSRSESDSRFYPRDQADARFLRPEGEIRIATGPTNWVIGPNLVGGTQPVGTYFADAFKLSSSQTVTAFAEVTPELPAALYGHATRIAGVELCYGANANALLQSALLEVVSESDGIGAPPGLTPVASDLTPRSDSACRTYRASSPVPIGPSDYVLFGVTIDYPTASASSILLGRTTFLLQA